jgi:UDP-N-acetylmuramate dehydrogenase
VELDKTFVSLKNFKNIKELGNGLVEVEAGLDFDKLIEFMEEKDYTGLENLAGIPGSVGGLIYMNGGAYGSEVFDCIQEIEVLDENNEISWIKKEELHFTYRKTEIQEKKWVVISAVFKFSRGFDKARVDEIKEKRESSHPLELPNLGSTFKNPQGHFSAKLIIESGMQGYSVGDAQISKKHPNFIVNKGNATFKDVNDLIRIVKERVREKSGLELQEEIIIVEK